MHTIVILPKPEAWYIADLLLTHLQECALFERAMMNEHLSPENEANFISPSSIPQLLRVLKLTRSLNKIKKYTIKLVTSY
jgi:hypothetical protein